MYYCKRNNIINCHIGTLYKYLKLFDIDRSPKKKLKKKFKSGYRAKVTNEYWHIDITEVPYGNKSKAYFQVIVGNYSRITIFS